MKDLWIVVPSWEKFQLRSDRLLPWFRVYYVLSRHDAWRSLSLSARGLLVSIWLEYGPSKGRIRLSDITHRTGQRVRRETLDSLVAAGFIELSATQPPELEATPRVRAREEESKEVDTPNPAKRGTRENNSNPRALGTNPRAVAKHSRPKRNAERWIENGLAAQIPPEQLATVIADEFGINDPDLLEELVTKARTP